MIAHFISFLYIQDYQPSTIASYVSALSYVHKMKLYDDPTDSFYIKKILKGTQNFEKISRLQTAYYKGYFDKVVSGSSFCSK